MYEKKFVVKNKRNVSNRNKPERQAVSTVGILGGWELDLQLAKQMKTNRKEHGLTETKSQIKRLSCTIFAPAGRKSSCRGNIWLKIPAVNYSLVVSFIMDEMTASLKPLWQSNMTLQLCSAPDLSLQTSTIVAAKHKMTDWFLIV